MGAFKIIAVVLIITGVLGLVYGSFTYPKEKHEGKMGPIEITIKEKKTINIPVWAGVSAIVLGSALMFIGSKSK